MRFFTTGVWIRRLRSALLVLVFVSAFLYIFSLNFRVAGKMDGLQRLVTEVVSPPLRLVGDVFTSLDEVVKNYVWLRNLRSENEALKSRIALLQNQVTTYQEAYIENQRLRRLLDFKKATGYNTLAAQVVVHDLTGWFQTLLVDKGFKDGVSADMPVVNEEGVIGRILEVSDHYSRVLLITDQGSAVDAIDVRNRVRGILCGKDANGCILKYVNANLDMEEGDLIITSGKDGIFPRGLRLGVVHAVYRDPAGMFQRIDVKPLVQLSRIQEVLILKCAKVDMGPVRQTSQSVGQPPPGTPVGLDVSKRGSGKTVGPSGLKPAREAPGAATGRKSGQKSKPHRKKSVKRSGNGFSGKTNSGSPKVGQ
ncbi:MAG: rod shape-determining protein MreC [Syntrophobacteraceae bacterium]